MTRDKDNFLLSPFASNFALNDSSVAEKYQIPMVQGGSASTQIYGRGCKYIFGTLPPADDYFASTIEMLGKLDPKAKTVALLSADDSFDSPPAHHLVNARPKWGHTQTAGDASLRQKY